MTDLTPTPTPHRATQEHWAVIASTAASDYAYGCAFLELRARVEALEAQQQAQQAQPAAPAGDADAKLIWQIARAIGWDYTDHWEPEGSDVIRVVARWLRGKGWALAADHLEQEVER